MLPVSPRVIPYRGRKRLPPIDAARRNTVGMSRFTGPRRTAGPVGSVGRWRAVAGAERFAYSTRVESKGRMASPDIRILAGTAHKLLARRLTR